ncbi:hypothetical protein [Halegenticoccus tardaugens]|uniref:hypothetical protein n=1 Tax=Halegenticoccus tardaugens TaxID=2071624 RepID=UPI00100A951F|nr:hypothetical protein [Halegenticoccus tardaugens]
MESTTDHPPIPELPALEPGLQLLKAESYSLGPLHTLVVDHASLNSGRAYWVDTHSHAHTNPLAQLAPDRRVCERIQVARAFTPFQHTALAEALAETVNTDTSLLVLPALDGMYRDDSLRATEGTDMLVRVLASLAGVARKYNLPVLVTRSQKDEFSEPIETAATEIIECEQTQFGPRFVADSFETLVYPVSGGHLQTTLAFWERILQARQPLYETAQTGPQTPGVIANGSN